MPASFRSNQMQTTMSGRPTQTIIRTADTIVTISRTRPSAANTVSSNAQTRRCTRAPNSRHMATS